MTRPKNERLPAALSGGNHRARCPAFRELCPCRNNRRELEARRADLERAANNGVRDDPASWREIFERALKDGRREREAAAHTIGTLTEKPKTSDEWRGLPHELRDDLDAPLQDPRASQQVLGTMKRHGHAHRGAACKNYRRRRKALDLATSEELAARVNWRWQLSKAQAPTAHDAGVRRLVPHMLRARKAVVVSPDGLDVRRGRARDGGGVDGDPARRLNTSAVADGRVVGLEGEAEQPQARNAGQNEGIG